MAQFATTTNSSGNNNNSSHSHNTNTNAAATTTATTSTSTSTSVLHVAAAFGGTAVLQSVLWAKADVAAPGFENVVAAAVQENRATNAAVLALLCADKRALF